MSREMRADLQGEVARLQRALENQTAEADMLRSNMAAQRELSEQNAAPDEAAKQWRKAAEDAEARAAMLMIVMARHRDEANALSEELETLKDTYEIERNRWAAAARTGGSDRALPPGPLPAHVPAKTAGGHDEEGTGSSGGEHSVRREHGDLVSTSGHDDAAPSRPSFAGGDAEEAEARQKGEDHSAASTLSVGADLSAGPTGLLEVAEGAEGIALSSLAIFDSIMFYRF